MRSNFSDFDFKEFRNQEVLVFITGPGYLEFPWGVETALRLNDVGARVSIIDLSRIAERYAMRLTLGSLRLPPLSRKFFRFLFLRKKSRIENVVSRVAESRNIPYSSYPLRRFKRVTRKYRQSSALSSYSATKWGAVPAYEILRTVMSNRLRALVDDDCLVPKSLESEIREPILYVSAILATLLNKSKSPVTSIFVCNGRQPIQAAITLGARQRGIKAILYECAGGFIFPTKFEKRIDYFISSPHDVNEMRQKISAMSTLSQSELYSDSILTRNLILERKEIPYRLNFLPKNTSSSYMHSKTGKTWVFFTTSEWELSCLTPWKESGDCSSEVFNNQYESIRVLRSLMPPDHTLVIRLHPSDPGKKSEPEYFWNKFAPDPNIEIIWPNDNVDSYWLSMTSNLNFVWASFLGVELILRKLPVCILGPSIYSHLVPTSVATTINELKSWISKPTLANTEQLLPYFAYLARGGVPILYSETSENREVSICGELTDLPRRLGFKAPSLLLKAIS